MNSTRRISGYMFFMFVLFAFIFLRSADGKTMQFAVNSDGEVQPGLSSYDADDYDTYGYESFGHNRKGHDGKDYGRHKDRYGRDKGNNHYYGNNSYYPGDDSHMYYKSNDGNDQKKDNNRTSTKYRVRNNHHKGR